GRVAERRVAKLLRAGARVRVVSRSFTPALRRLEGENLTLVEEELDEDSIAAHMRGALLVFAATSSAELNSAIVRLARRRGKLVNRADGMADFLLPACFEVGDVVVAVSTRGRSPAVAKIIKRRIKKAVTQEDILLIELQEFLREALKRRVQDQAERSRMLREACRDERILERLRKGDLEGAKQLALSYLEA
ncbi:MAG: bifunctional precorrin-2 dehydrogenase/sirohydrochlorin ferrochelatase, partial [Euryarchaeota archaeon]|nr:bifunctional precorrin-2 dehydrogenase/sirohydrochlorin ferrochelatase [Euryarchaeota archaeon]